MRVLRRNEPRRQAGRVAAALLATVLLAGFLLLAWQWMAADARLPQAQQPRPREAAVGLQIKNQGSSSRTGKLSGVPPPIAKPRKKKAVTDAIRQRCQGTLGTWCIDFWTQPEVPAVTAPRGRKTCSLDCNKVGTCSALSGLCTCPAGWAGFNCLHPSKRQCVQSHRSSGFERPPQEPNISMGVGWESIFGFPQSHCAGYCDDTIAACFCPSNTTYGRIPAPEDAQQGSPPVQRGRPMGIWCQPNKTPDGRDTAWGTVDPQDLFGPEGWCMAAQPKHTCDCFLEGWGGGGCLEPHEQFCFNQCNGRGECLSGYCKCHPGWHGIDCAHRSTTADADKPGLEAERPWITPFIHTPAAQDFPPGATRKRPLIYVYEMPSEYSTLMLQWRWGGEYCVPRLFTLDNSSVLSGWTYSAEPVFLEMLLQSEHRTLDPEEADFFYVPVFTSCFIHPVRDLSDSLRDFFYSVGHNRVQGATNMLLEAYHWIASHHPWWDRRGGRDHIWLVTHDEASCWVPAAIRSSIILSHWGRKDLNHTSNTAYGADDYSVELKHPQFEPDGYLQKIQGWPCHDPVKDLVVPLMKAPSHYHLSPLIGAPTRNRTWLAFHRGRVQMEAPAYSRGIRQRLAKAAKEGSWLEKYRIAVGEHQDIPGDYSELLASSVFCLVVPGDGWSARMDDATLHGCIPVIIMDEVDVSFQSIVNLSAFTLRIPEADAEKLPEILLAVPQERREEMQRNLARVWQRFAYSSYRPYAKRFKVVQMQYAAAFSEGAPPQLSLPARLPNLDPEADDAFGTIMAWLYSRVGATRCTDGPCGNGTM